MMFPAILASQREPSLIGSLGFDDSGGTSDITVDISSLNVGPGDVVICAYAVSDYDTTYNIAGYTEVADLYSDKVGYDVSLLVGYKTLTSPETSITLTGGSGYSIGRVVGVVFAFRNTGGFGSSATATGIETRAPNPPPLTVADGDVAFVVGAGTVGSISLFGYTSPELDDFLAQVSSFSAYAGIGAGWVVGTGGSFDPAAFVLNASDSINAAWCACTLSLTATG